MSTQPPSFSLSFRTMTLADVPRVHEVDKTSFSLAWSERSYRFEITENRNSINLVAEAAFGESKPVVIGMIVMWVILDEAHVATIAVHPDFRGYGIGRKLLAKGLSAAYDRGARMAYLEVRKGNLPAQHLYDKFGFQVVGERPRYYKDNNEDALLMTLDSLQLEQLLALSG
jgi:[ribosomal protein S18]-alanine N-acetyltransferase